jgi:hypothetical protein
VKVTADKNCKRIHQCNLIKYENNSEHRENLMANRWRTDDLACLQKRSISVSRIGSGSPSTSFSAAIRKSSPNSTNTCFTRRSFYSLSMKTIRKIA